MSRLGHHVCLVEDDELEEAWFGVQSTRLCKGLDLFADDVDATVIRCIELRIGLCDKVRFWLIGLPTYLEDVLFELVAIDSTCNSDDRTRLACAWRSVEEEMRNAVLLNKLFD